VIEDVARLLQEVVADGRDDAARVRVERLVAEGLRVPGLGHNLHEKDPRVAALIAVARRENAAGAHVQALAAVHEAAMAVTGRQLLVNATGAVGAILSDLGYAPETVRGFALVSRCAGLFVHAADERRQPLARALWESAHGVRTTE
jgi:citrate synthase